MIKNYFVKLGFILCLSFSLSNLYAQESEQILSPEESNSSQYAKRIINPVADNRCDQAFMDRFRLERDCATGRDRGSCTYLKILYSRGANVAVGALGAVIALDSVRLNTISAELTKFKNAFESQKAIEKEYLLFRRKADVARVAGFEAAYRKIVGDSPKAIRDSISGTTTDYLKALDAEIEKKFKASRNGEIGEYKFETRGVLYNREAIKILQDDKSGIDDAKLKKMMEGFRQSLSTLSEKSLVKGSLFENFLKEVDQEFRTRAKNDANRMYEPHDPANSILLKRALVLGVLAPMLSAADNHSKDLKRAASIERAKNIALGALLGNSLLVISDVVSSRKVRSCSDSLELSEDEVELISASVKKTTSSAKCGELRLLDPVKTMDDAFVKMGFVPTGTCELLQRESTTLARLVKNIKPIGKPGCDSIKYEKGFSVSSTPEGIKTLKCPDLKSNMNFFVKANSENQFDFQLATVTAQAMHSPIDREPGPGEQEFVKSFLSKAGEFKKAIEENMTTGTNFKRRTHLEIADVATRRIYEASFKDGSTNLDAETECVAHAVAAEIFYSSNELFNSCNKTNPADKPSGKPSDEKDEGKSKKDGNKT